MSKRDLRIAIVGAGIGGTTAAVLLQQAGYDCTVYEQSPEFRRVGAGINFAPNGTRVFRAMGLGSKILEAGVQPRSKVNLEWDTGRIFHLVHLSELVERYGAPFVAFHRGDLHDVLASTTTPGTFQLGKRLETLERSESSVHLHFKDGTVAAADAVIGADGLHSRVRDVLLGPEPPTYCGRVAYRSIFPRTLLGDIELADNTRWWAKDRYVLIYFMKEQRDEVYVVTGGPEEWGSDDFTPMSVDPGRLHAAFEDFHSNVRDLLELCSDVSRWPILVRAPSMPWTVGPVTLVGDACHPMTPHLGQGGGMAVEDAAMLVRCLDAVNGEDPERAFRLYEANRYERTATVTRESDEDRLGRGEIDHGWLYGYDVLTVPLAPLTEQAR